MARAQWNDLALSRRALLKNSILGGGTALMSKFFAGAFQGTASAAGAQAMSTNPVIETAAGKIRGFSSEGVYAFKGIPYGASTTGKNRFMPPVKPEPWTGVRDALQYGHSAPQTIANAPSIFSAMDFLVSAENPRGIEEAEDCLVLNVWMAPNTVVKSLTKRPVMVWLHGGAFTSGSGSAPLYNGATLARWGNVVVVTVNHRLGALGYTYLRDVGGDAFGASGNVGMLDIVAALQWVRDNIAEFGGDPGRVLIFGESGGGQKVSTLLAMPAAKGLFHRAVIESGPGVKMNALDHATRVADIFLAELSITRDRIAELQTIPIERIMAAQGAVNRKLGPFIPGMVQGFSPMVDGVSLRQNPFDPVAPDVSADVPLLIGWNRTELTLFAAGDPALFSLDEAGMERRIRMLLGGNAPSVLRAFRNDYPDENPSGLYFLIASAYPTVAYTAKIAERRAAKGKAPTFVYEFTWETPILGGKLRSPHTIEMPFVFANVFDPLVQKLCGSGKDISPLAEHVSGAWAAFAAAGDPNSKGFPHWPAYSAAHRNVMLINTESKVDRDPQRESRVAIEKILFPSVA